MTVRYKKKKAQLHLRSVNPRQHTASSRKTRLPNAEGEAAPPPPHVNGSPSGLRRCQWKPVRLATSKWFPHQIFSWSFEFFDWPAVTTRCSTKERERDRERQSKRESASTHRSQRPPPPPTGQSRLGHTERETTSPPSPTKKRSEKLCHSLMGAGTGTGCGGRSGSGGQPGPALQRQEDRDGQGPAEDRHAAAAVAVETRLGTIEGGFTWGDLWVVGVGPREPLDQDVAVLVEVWWALCKERSALAHSLKG